MAERRAPRVEHGGEADARAQMLWVGGDGAQRVRSRAAGSSPPMAAGRTARVCDLWKLELQRLADELGIKVWSQRSGHNSRAGIQRCWLQCSQA